MVIFIFFNDNHATPHEQEREQKYIRSAEALMVTRCRPYHVTWMTTIVHFECAPGVGISEQHCPSGHCPFLFYSSCLFTHVCRLATLFLQRFFVVENCIKVR